MVAAELSRPAAAGWLRSRPKLRAALQRNVTGWLFILPALIGFGIFYLYPTLRAVEISLTDWNLMRAPKFIGFDNYLKLIDDPRFWQSARITVAYVLYNIPLQTVLGLALAVMMDRLSKSVALRAVVIAPYLLSNVIAALIWLWLLDPLLGMTNAFLGLIDVPRQSFLATSDLAIMSIAGINIWRHVGLTALLFYAGLQAIPRSLYEAARLEGAGEWVVFRRITLPLLRPVLVFVLVTSVIGSFQVFDTIAVTTQGGPANSTSAIIWYVYESAFRFSKMGYASAMSVALFAVLILITILQMRALRAGSSDLE
ncbi:sugar ABC transporter permease [Mycobacterium sp. KBS0706]|uniref:carbohydrate ABC transporter permease n=1 Tax=Mycobacterium sp. KBS0706 TaxID=2578109 RepID=UPI00110FA7D4|nr:sugar ABC transporter permease [Mycobacterium sp. KBS0706]TSD89617.1 sugar ABC transporter permease [Mycobacterium sp. KBS0706]